MNFHTIMCDDESNSGKLKETTYLMDVEATNKNEMRVCYEKINTLMKWFSFVVLAVFVCIVGSILLGSFYNYFVIHEHLRVGYGGLVHGPSSRGD